MEGDDGLKATSTAICMYLSLDFYLLRKLSFHYSGRIFEQVSASDFKCTEPSFDSHDHESIVKKLNGYLGCTCWASLVAQTVKRLPTMQETRLRSLGRKDLLEKAMVTHSSTLAWKIPWTKEPGRLQSMGLQRVGHDWAASLNFTSLKIYYFPTFPRKHR